MNKSRWPIFLLLLIVLVSCRSSNHYPEETMTPKGATQTANLKETPTLWVIPIFTAIPTSPNQSPTIKPTSTESYITADNPIPECAGKGVPISPSSKFGLPGTIVYQKGKTDGLYTIGGAPLSTSKIPTQFPRYSAVLGFSPNGKEFAYSPVSYDASGNIEYDKLIIVLLSADGEKIEHNLDLQALKEKIDPEDRFEGFSSYSYWINDRQIYGIIEHKSTDPHASHIFGLPAILDPFGGSLQTDLIDQLPNQFVEYDNEVGISPDMSRIIYGYGGNLGIALKDIIQDKTIWAQTNFPIFPIPIIRWTADSSIAAVATLATGDPIVLLVSRDGDVTNLIAKTTFLSSNFKFSFIAWSPNGRYLALIVMATENSNSENSVFVYDATKREFIMQCPITGYKYGASPIFWSPDNLYIAYAGRDGDPLQVLNLQTGENIELLKDAIIAGWSSQFPKDWQPKK